MALGKEINSYSKQTQTNWNSDLSFGKQCEVTAGYILESHLGASGLRFTEGYDPLRDFYLVKDGQTLQIETKGEGQRGDKRTNNTFFELFKLDGQPCGLNTSASDILAEVYPHRNLIAYAPLQDVLNFIQASGAHFTPREGAGDGGRISGVTIPTEKYLAQDFVTTIPIPGGWF